MARQEGGIIRVRPGQVIPVVHFVALGDRPLFVAPLKHVRVRELRSGRSLEDDELALRPTISVEVVHDPALLAAAARFDTSPRIPGVQEPSIVFSAPAITLLAPKTWPKKSFVLYQHIFGEGNSYPDDGYFYVGVTKRSWQARWSEHRRAIAAGSPLLFHRTLRNETNAGRVTYIHHKVMGITVDLDALYSAEERLVEGHWLDARRLNMIPGGKSGLKYLRENGMLSERVVPLPDERDRVVETWLREHPRTGLPAPWVAEKWKDEAWAVAQICGREDRLSVEQVRAQFGNLREHIQSRGSRSASVPVTSIRFNASLTARRTCASCNAVQAVLTRTTVGRLIVWEAVHKRQILLMTSAIRNKPTVRKRRFRSCQRCDPNEPLVGTKRTSTFQNI
jgi:hypothetical protein